MFVLGHGPCWGACEVVAFGCTDDVAIERWSRPGDHAVELGCSLPKYWKRFVQVVWLSEDAESHPEE